MSEKIKLNPDDAEVVDSIETSATRTGAITVPAEFRDGEDEYVIQLVRTQSGHYMRLIPVEIETQVEPLVA